MDQYNYDRLGYSLNVGRPFFPGTVYSLPGYQTFIFSVYFLIGRSLFAVRVIQAMAGALAGGLLFLLGRKTVGRTAALLAAAVFIVYGPALIHESLIIPTIPAIFFSLAALVWWVYLPGKNQLLSLLAGGIFLGISSLFSAANLLFSFLVLCFYLPRIEKGRGGMLKKLFAAGAGIVIIVLPFILRNFRPAQGFVPLTAHSGINFYIGNNPESDGTFSPPLFLTPSAMMR